MCLYPQTPEDEVLLDNFRDICIKYQYLIIDGLIIKPKNGTYARLSVTHQRGKRAGLELVNFLTRGLILDAPLTILNDIELTVFCIHKKSGTLGCKNPLSFMILGDSLPEYKILNYTPPKRIEFYNIQ